MKLTFKKKYKEAKGVYSFVFEAPKNFSWQAGQFIFYTLPHNNPDDRGITRYFTISSAPLDKVVRITTRIEKDGSTFKKNLMKLTAGDKIEATGPDGDFILDDVKKNNIFISGGIGITPYYSILKDLDQKNLPINATLLYANSDENFVFKEELEALVAKYPTFKIKYFVSPKHIEQEDIKAAIDEIGNEPSVWFSGPEKMTEAFEKILKEDLKLPEERLKFDYFPGYDIIK